jgi:hypothetical protein
MRSFRLNGQVASLRRLAAVALAATVCVVVGCQAPTQGVLAIYTDMPCVPLLADGARNALTDFRIYTGATRAALGANLANGPFAAEGVCTEGNRGRLLGNVTLSGKGTVFVAVRAGTWALGKAATREAECNQKPEACLVAERTLEYASHQSLEVPVTLDAACAQRPPCGDGKTCIQGQCTEVPVYSASSPAPAHPPAAPVLTDLDSGMTTGDSGEPKDAPDARDAGAQGLDASPVSDAGADAGSLPPRPRWYAVCNNGVASVQERPRQDAGATAAPTCFDGAPDSPVAARRMGGAGYEVCTGFAKPPVAASSISLVCGAAMMPYRCCMTPSTPGAPAIPLLVSSGPEPVGSVCSAGGEMGISKSPCFAPGECASGTCTMLKAADDAALGYGECL